MTTINVSVSGSSNFTVNVCCCSGSCSVSTGSSEFSPTDVSGLLHWYRSDLDITDNSGSVSCWSDQVGTAHFTQSLSAQQPLLMFNALNGQNVVRFNSGTVQNDPGLSADGSSKMDQLVAAISTVPQPYTIGIIWQQWGPALGTFDGSGDDAKNYVFSTFDPSGSGAIYVIDGPSFHTPGIKFQSNTALQSATVLNDAYSSGSQQFGLSFFIGSGSSSKVYNRGQLIAAGNAGTDGLVNHFVLCGREPDTRGGSYMDIVELMIFTGSINYASMSKLNSYAMERYGLSW